MLHLSPTPLLDAAASQDQLQGFGRLPFPAFCPIRPALRAIAPWKEPCTRRYRPYSSSLSCVAPFPIQIGTNGIGTQVTEHTPIQTHARDNVQCIQRQYLGHHVVLVVALALRVQSQDSHQQTFGLIFCHGFSRMLSMNDPANAIATAHGNAMYRSVFQR
jgi:hypothetical protein